MNAVRMGETVAAVDGYDANADMEGEYHAAMVSSQHADPGPEQPYAIHTSELSSRRTLSLTAPS